MKPTVMLLCGFRRTGKDMLCEILQSKNITNRFPWLIYSNTTKKLDGHNKYIRFGFADELKLEAAKIYNIPEVIPDNMKDIKCFVHPTRDELVSARDIYIEWGSIRLKEDSNYWVNIVANKIHGDATYIITDYRFPQEYEIMSSKFDNIITVRLYRSDVPEPPPEVASEHSLDNTTTDFLLVKDLEDFIKASNRFPQYKNYVLTGVL